MLSYSDCSLTNQGGRKMPEEKKTFQVIAPDGELKEWEIENSKEIGLVENKFKERRAISVNVFFRCGRWAGKIILGWFSFFVSKLELLLKQKAEKKLLKVKEKVEREESKRLKIKRIHEERMHEEAKRKELILQSIDVLDNAGYHEKAARIAKETGSYERAIDILDRTGHHEKAAEIAEEVGNYGKAIDILVRSGHHGKAGRIGERLARRSNNSVKKV